MPDHVRQEILATHDVSFVVIAGAGTGKTTLLIEKILALLREGRTTIQQLAAITFTEKAAAEIALRLKDRLDQELAAGRDATGRLLEAREHIDASAISTLHGFAGRLLRERPVEAHLPPDHRVQDAVQSALLFDELFQRWEEEQLSEERLEWRRLLEQALAPDLRELAWQFALNLDTVLDYPIAKPPPPESLGPRFQMALNTPLERIRGALPSATNPEDPAVVQAQLQSRMLSELPRELLEDPPRLIAGLRDLPVNKRAGRKNGWRHASALDEVRLATVEIKEAVEGLEAGWRDVLAYEAYQVLLGFLTDLQREKQARGLVDFQDLLRLTRNLLRDELHVREYFQEKFTVLLVDEFQDTDPLQAEILFYLAESGPRARDWRDVLLVPGKLFIVGDPKQSIYRFRRADVEVFDTVRSRVVEQGGRERTLERNFRSLSGIVHFVNAYFGQQIRPPEDGGKYQSRYDQLDPVRRSPFEEPCVEILIDEKSVLPALDGEAGATAKAPHGRAPETEDEGRGFSADEARAREAAVMAERLRQMLGGEKLVADGEGRREVRAGDVAILFRATTHLDVYTDALRDRDIPFRVIGSKRFYAAPEIIDLANLLRTIAAPHDTVALVGTLRSPAFGLADPEITALARAHALDFRFDPKLSALEQGCDERMKGWLSGLEPRVQKIYKILRDLHRQRDRVPLSQIVGEALTRTSLWAAAYAAFGGEQKALNLEKVRALARTYEAAGMRSLIQFTDALLEAIRGHQQEEESSAAEEGDNVVRILTVHKAKGLEWPVVFLPGLMSAPDKGGGNFLEDREGGRFGFRLKDAMTSNFKELQEREKPRLEAEFVRLLYVAATRARDYLVLTGVHHDREGDSPLQRMSIFFEEQAGARWRAGPTVPLNGWSEEARKRELERATVRLGDVEGLKAKAEMSYARRSLIEMVERAGEPDVALRRSEVEASRQEAQTRRAALTVSRAALTWISPSKLAELLQPVNDGQEQEEHRMKQEAETRSALIGTVVHRALEFVDFKASPDARTAVERAARILAWEQQPVPTGVREEATVLVSDLLASSLGARLRRATSLNREVPILYRPTPDMAIDGRIDLIFQEPGGALVVLDYKTDEVEPGGEERQALMHLPQLELYALAVKEVSGITPASIVLYFLRTGVTVEYEVDAMMLDRARERLEGMEV